MKKTFESIIYAALYGFFGLLLGCFVYALFCGFFGDLWTVEACGSALVIYSPIAVPGIVGFVGGLFQKVNGLIGKCIFSAIAYILGWVGAIIGVGMVTAGPGAFVAVTLVLGLLCGGAPIYIIIFG